MSSPRWRYSGATIDFYLPEQCTCPLVPPILALGDLVRPMTAPENVQLGITGSSDEFMEQLGVPYLPWRQALQFHNAILLAVDAPSLPLDVDASEPRSCAGEPLSLSAPLWAYRSLTQQDG
jgi:hypothetical protein